MTEVSRKVNNDEESARIENFGKFSLGHIHHLVCGKYIYVYLLERIELI